MVVKKGIDPHILNVIALPLKNLKVQLLESVDLRISDVNIWNHTISGTQIKKF